MKSIRTLFGILLVTLVLVSCGGGGGGGGGGGSAPATSNSLIGTWYGPDSAGWFSSSGNYFLEFSFDGTNLAIKNYASDGTTLLGQGTVPYRDSGSSFSFNTAEIVFTDTESGTNTGITRVVSYDYSINGNNLTVSNCKYDGVLQSSASVVMTRR